MQKTFKGTEKALCRLFRDPQVRDEMQNHRIEWRFNLERAPKWLQRYWENAGLTFDEFLTVLIEVEATLNSRLLTYDYSNPTEEEVLTPAHLIHGRRITILPDLQDDKEEEVGITR